MAIVAPPELRQKATNLRSMSLNGDDLYLKIVLMQLADDFEREAAEHEARSARAVPVPIHQSSPLRK